MSNFIKAIARSLEMTDLGKSAGAAWSISLPPGQNRFASRMRIDLPFKANQVCVIYIHISMQIE